MLEMVLMTLCVSSHLILKATLRGNILFFSPHFTDEVTDTKVKKKKKVHLFTDIASKC